MASDAFTSASNPLASPWASSGSFASLRATGGACQNDSGTDTDSWMRYSTSSETSSEAVYVSGTTDGGPAIHMDSSGNGYIETAYDGASIYIYRLDAGSYTFVGSVTGVYTAGQPNKIRRSGSNLIAAKNGTDVLTAGPDNTYTGGNPGIFSYAGNLVQDTWTDGAAAGAAYTLTADQGTYTLTGQTVELTAARSLDAAQGSYALTGQSVGLAVGRKIDAEQGSYALSGQDVTLSGPIAGYTLDAEQGSYTLSGSDSMSDYAITAESGSYALSGQDVGLSWGHKTSLDTGSYALNGQAITLRKASAIVIDHGSYALSGQDITIRTIAYALSAEPGVYEFSGQSVALSYSGAPDVPYPVNRPFDPFNWYRQ